VQIANGTTSMSEHKAAEASAWHGSKILETHVFDSWELDFSLWMDHT
jgi:hypothetical protein